MTLRLCKFVAPQCRPISPWRRARVRRRPALLRRLDPPHPPRSERPNADCRAGRIGGACGCIYERVGAVWRAWRVSRRLRTLGRRQGRFVQREALIERFRQRQVCSRQAEDIWPKYLSAPRMANTRVEASVVPAKAFFHETRDLEIRWPVLLRTLCNFNNIATPYTSAHA